MEIIIIVAMTAQRIIGKGNRIPWDIPSEQRFFKHITMGHPVVMGRKTYQSIGHPLSGRTNLIVSSQLDLPSSTCHVVSSLEEALFRCRQAPKVFIIGGFFLYQEAMKRADTLLVSLIDLDVDGDVYFPEIPLHTFAAVGSVRCLGPVSYTITKYRRASIPVPPLYPT